jgi:hypothetical protein
VGSNLLLAVLDETGDDCLGVNVDPTAAAVNDVHRSSLPSVSVCHRRENLKSKSLLCVLSVMEATMCSPWKGPQIRLTHVLASARRTRSLVPTARFSLNQALPYFHYA